MKKILLACAILFVVDSAKAQNAITSYTLTPNSIGGTKVSISFNTSGRSGQVTEYPVNSLYPVWSSDSTHTHVRFFCIYDIDKAVMAISDSIIHFYTAGVHFTTYHQLDSFYQTTMLR